MGKRFVSLFLFLTAILLYMVLAEATPTHEDGGQPAPIYVIEVHGAISPGSAEFVSNSLKTAAAEKAQALVIALDTPGGLAQSMRTMVKDIMNAPLPVIVYISPTGAQAASAGVMITMSADIAAMAPGTNIGAAHPVGGGGQDIPDEMGRKVLNDMVAFAQGIAKERGRNSSWVKKAVEQSVSITAGEAVELKVVDLIAEDQTDLLRKIDGRNVKRTGLDVVLKTGGAPVVILKQSLRDRILSVLSDPNIAYILMMIGLAGLYFELSHPGAILPGVLGGMSLILAFYSFQTLPVNYAGLLLILLAIILFILEIKVASYGMLTVGGLVSLTLGSIMLFRTPENYMNVSLGVMIPVLVTIGGFFAIVTLLVLKSQVGPSTTGESGLIGLTGPVKEWRQGRGKVLVHGEWWQATGESDMAVGDQIEVAAVDGMKLVVRKHVKT
jgi:membrane-bound serine protease (ClpP class)